MLQNKNDHQQEDSTTTSTDQETNVVDSDHHLSDNEAYEMNPTPSPKKRKGTRKRVISVPIGEGHGSRSRAEVYPPPDSWSWRKYGQKPIKGSPYPRGYYRCSSSKGCPARKQVERNRLDPSMLLITYSCEHNHPLPTTTTKHHQLHHHSPTAAASSTTTDTATAVASTSSSSTETNESEKSKEIAFFGMNQLLPELDHSSSLARELGWFSDVGTTTIMLDSPMLVGPAWMDADVALMLPINGEEDQSLFGDLGELPECSMVFRRPPSRGVVADSSCCGSAA